MGSRHLRETDLARQRGDALLMLGVAITVHENDRRRSDPVIVSRLQGVARSSDIQRYELLTVRIYPFVDLHNSLVQQLWQLYMAGKYLRSILVGNAQGVAKAARNDQQCALALAFQQRVGRHGGAHLHRLDALRRDVRITRQAQHLTDALQCRIPVALRVVRQ